MNYIDYIEKASMKKKSFVEAFLRMILCFGNCRNFPGK